MSVNGKVILAIVKKDLHGLLPLILLALAVFVMQPVIAKLNLENEAEFWSTLQWAFHLLGYFVATLLMISVVQLDPATSLNHDWLTRPIPRIDWLLAKLSFLLLTVCLPIVLARFAFNLAEYGFGGSLRYAIAIQIPPALLATPILFAIALLTPTLKRTILVIVVICMIFMIPAWDGGRRLLSRIGIDISNDFGSMIWVQTLPILAAGIGSALLVYWLLYCRRRPGRAWLAFGTGFTFVFACIFPPASIYGWDEVVAIHKRMINEPDDSLDQAVKLEHAQACFPAAPMDRDAAGEAADPVLVQAAWEDQTVAQAEPGSLTFATTVDARSTLREWFSPSNTVMDVPVDWRIDRIRAQGRFTADSMPDDVDLTRSRLANTTSDMSSSDTEYWLIPGRAADALYRDPSTRLILDYELALLSPTSYELRTDGRRYEFPALGSCRARINSSTSRIDIDCLKQGTQPALVSAELVGVPSGRVDAAVRPNYAPGWLESIGLKRYELALDHPNLVDSSVVMLNAYKVERILHKRLESRGMLGGPASICPTPADKENAPIEKSTWSDKSPHDVSLIAVERGVRIEVLDWRKGDQGGKPVLFLIPGLGGTAHSYDDLAPKLARKYAVVAMTRRGIGASARPDHGYDIARLSQDVIQVLDTLGLESPILVGHSLGGEELSYLGAHAPERFAGLIYLDAAYDRVTDSAKLPLPTVMLPSRPPPRPSDLVSYAALQRYFQRTTGSPRTIPEGEIMAMYDLSRGAFEPKYDPLYLDAIEMGLQAPDYASIPLPALGVFAVPTSPESKMEPWYDRNDPVIRQAVTEGFEWEKRLKSAEIAHFSEGVAHSQVLILDDAQHWIFVSNEEDVLHAIDAFVDQL